MGKKKRKPCRKGINRATDFGAYVPTEAEIAAECARFREGWSEEEHHRRAGLVVEPVTVPEMVGEDLYGTPSVEVRVA